MNHNLLTPDDLQEIRGAIKDLQAIRGAVTALAEHVSDLERQLQGTQPYPRQAAPNSSIMNSNGELPTAETRAASG